MKRAGELARKTPLKASKILPRTSAPLARTAPLKKRRKHKPSDSSNRSPDWLSLVRAIPHCVVCGKIGQQQAAHENQGKGMGWKVPDCLTAAICSTCHHEIDNGSTLTLEVRRAMLARAILKTITWLFKNKLIGPVVA